MSYSEQHGTQIGYTSRDGAAYLWYPGNRRVVTGEWKTITDNAGFGRICFRYGRDTFNPVTRVAGGDWACTPAAYFIRIETGYARGDLFNLRSGRLPFILPRGDRLSFSDVQGIIKSSS